jgi:predicted RNA-binding protein YlxR (DUF448 family)
MCVGCRAVLSKRTLIRIVRTPQGVVVDPTGKLAGRGAYLHNQRSCWMKGIKGALAQALRAEISQEDIDRLLAFADTLSDESFEAQGPLA